MTDPPLPAPQPVGPAGEGKVKTILGRVAELVKAGFLTLFRGAQDGHPYMTVATRDGSQTVPLHSEMGEQVLWGIAQQALGFVPGAEALSQVTRTICLQAFAGAAEPVHLRVAGLNGAMYLDLRDGLGRVVQVDAQGWQVLAKSPIRFVSTKEMMPLPVPVSGGSLELLRPYFNLADQASFHLVVGFLMAVLHPRPAYMVLELQGEQGSGKSTTARLIKRLVDPCRSEIRALPRKEQEIAIAMQGQHLLVFDNERRLGRVQSDALCRMVDGASFTTRTLYTTAGETALTGGRPIILTGIEPVVVQGDLADRTISVSVPALSGARRSEDELLESFRGDHPAILGALLDGVVAAIRYADSVTLPWNPRNVDLARWLTGAERGLGFPSGAILDALLKAKAEAQLDVLEASPIYGAVVDAVANTGSLRGTATELLDRFRSGRAGYENRPHDWPRDATKFAGELRRITPALRAVDITITFTRLNSAHRTRLIEIKREAHGARGESRP